MRKPIVHAVIDRRGAGYAKWEKMLAGLRGACAAGGAVLRVHFEEDIPRLDPENDSPVVLSGTDEMFLRAAIRQLKSMKIRVVLAGYNSDLFDRSLSCSSPSRSEEAKQVVEYLQGCGRRRIALVGFGYRSINDRLRFQAASDTMRALGLPHDVSDEFSWVKDPMTCVTSFLPKAYKYDAVMTPNDVMAVLLVNHLVAGGIKVPEQIYVTGFGNMMLSRCSSPTVTSTDMDMRTIGAQAFSAWQFLRRDSSGSLSFRVSVPSRIFPRESTAGAGATPQPEHETPAEEDFYYNNATIAPFEAMERCLVNLDAVDAEIASDLCDGYRADDICERNFLSEGALRYRLNRIYTNAGVRNRAEMLRQVRTVFGGANPFSRFSETDRRADADEVSGK